MRRRAVSLGLLAVLLVAGCGTESPPSPPANPLIVYFVDLSNSRIIPIDFSTHITLPPIQFPAGQIPTSLLFHPQGARAYLGSSAGLIIVDAQAHTYLTTVASAPGNVLAISSDGARILIFDSALDEVHVFHTGNVTVETFNGVDFVSAAAFIPGTQSSYLIGDVARLYQPGMPLQTVLPLGGLGVTVLASGSLAYLAAFGPNSPLEAHVLATCDNTLVDTVDSGGTLLDVKAAPVGNRVVGVDVSVGEVRFVDISAGTIGGGCPPSASNSLTLHPSGIQFGFSQVRQLTVTPDGARAFFTYLNDPAGPFNDGLPVYDLNSGAVSRITLAGGKVPISSGNSVTPDGRFAFVGAITFGSSSVHQVDLVAGTDVAQVDVVNQPFLVGLRP